MVPDMLAGGQESEARQTALDLTPQLRLHNYNMSSLLERTLGGIRDQGESGNRRTSGGGAAGSRNSPYSVSQSFRGRVGAGVCCVGSIDADAPLGRAVDSLQRPGESGGDATTAHRRGLALAVQQCSSGVAAVTDQASALFYSDLKERGLTTSTATRSKHQPTLDVLALLDSRRASRLSWPSRTCTTRYPRGSSR